MSLLKWPLPVKSSRARIHLKHYSIRTEQAYLPWMKEFILFYNQHHRTEMGAPEGEAGLSHYQFGQQHIVVRGAKGNEARVAPPS